MMIKKLFLTSFIFILSSSLNAKIIEVQQLFNKKLIKVQKEQFFTKKSFYGITKIDERTKVDVVTRFDGYITKLNADENLMILKKNQPLFSIYSDEILNIQNELQVSKKINDKAYNSVLSKLNTLNINKNEINKIKENKISFEGIKVYSPTNSIVLEKNINNGGFVKKGNRLFSLANIENLWFIASVYQEDLKYIKKGDNARIKIDGIEANINSKIDYIYPMANEKSKTIDVRFNIKNSDLKIFPNMFGKVDIKLNEKTSLTLPKTAVLNKASKYYVFKNISETEFEPIEVKVNRINSNKYEILSGLNENDEVINNALFLFDSDAITNMLYDVGSDDDW